MTVVAAVVVNITVATYMEYAHGDAKMGTGCQPGYYVNNDRNCGKCYYSGCTCTHYHGCDRCLEGYFDPGSKCRKSYPPNCKTGTSLSSCLSCKKGFYGSYCQHQCGTDCINGACDSDRAAYDCSTGYSGTHCDDCAIRRYGPACQYECSSGCVVSKCDNVTGTFSCQAGWTDIKCDKCLPYYYGNQCSRRCRKECLACDDYYRCQSCVRGRYGSYCQNTCGKGCVNNECYKSNGQCQCQSYLFQGYQCASCAPGKYGQYCNIDCPYSCYSCTKATVCASCQPGFFGEICEHNCSESCKTCSQSGQCVSCNAGYSHPNRQCMCQTSQCTSPGSCDQCVSNEYYPDNGSCCPCSFLQHCKSCKKTSNITNCIACDDGFFPNESGECLNCSLTCIEGQCNSLTGECKTGCESDYWGQFCEHKCNESCHLCNRSNGECLECASKMKHGPNCNIDCSETCVDKECYLSGKCINGCLKNNFGEMCENKCDKKCISNGNGTRCSSESGKCLHGCTPGYTAVVCPQVPQSEAHTLSGSSAAAIGGGVAGGLILIIAITVSIAFFLLNKRRAINRNEETATLRIDQIDEQYEGSSAVYATVNKNTVVHPDVIYVNTVDGAPQITVISNPYNKRPPEKNTSSELIYKEDNLEIDDEDAIARGNAIRFEENGGVYYNNASEVNKVKVQVEELPAYVTAKTKNSYETEFETFPYGLTKPYEDSQRANSMSRNRYKGIYPYDDSRVRIWYNGSDYINASFIDVWFMS